MAELLARIHRANRPAYHHLSPQQARIAYRMGAEILDLPRAPLERVEELSLPGPGGALAARLYAPSAARLPVLLYLHGGGFVTGSLDSHDGVCRALAAATPCVVVAVDYRLAPEHRFPAAVEDAWAATAWVAEHAASLGADPARVAVGGDSAGGTLAAVVALRARDRGLPLALQLLVYPVCDLACDTASYRELADGYGLTAAAMAWYRDRYLGPAGDPADPEASPLRAPDLADVAPALVLTAEYDPLRDEGEAYAQRLRAAGVPVTLVRYDGLIHGFYRMPAAIGRAREALGASAAALRSALAQG
ncbi:MAG: alpha/beta hydrolase [Thermoleophilia bacterium]|nr:alpha/beta hydrolase [Thermoleophilia bacterium]